MDARLQEVLLDYGLEGYGLYWYCLELITNKIDSDNIKFELEHDARVIARNTGSTVQKVQEMMTRFVEIGLFENLDGTITCLKLAKRLDKSMTNSPRMREFIESVRERHDIVRTCQPRIEEEEEKKENKNKVSKAKYSSLDWGLIGLTDQQKNDIKGIRTACKKKLTQLALNVILKELELAKNQYGIGYDESIEIWAVRGWTGFKAEWAATHKGLNNGQRSSNQATLSNLDDTNW